MRDRAGTNLEPAPVAATSLGSCGPVMHAPPWSALLELVYSRRGLPLPRLDKVTDEELPQPYRGLLVHSRDMTPTLQEFYQEPLGLRVLGRWREGGRYIREVLLHLPGSGRRVGFGAICVELRHLPPASAGRVLEEQAPFGSILQRDGIPHLSWSQAFFRAEPDVHMRNVLQTREGCRLYGRRNVLLDGGRRLLAEVIEVLAPVRSGEGGNPPGNPTSRSGNGA